MYKHSPLTVDGLQTDLYELTMAAGYFQNKVDLKATFELICHTMPANRSFLVACGLQQIIDYVLHLKFSDDDIAYLKSLPVFKNVSQDFFAYLKGFKFTGDLLALPEGEIFLAREPVIQIEAPIIEAQIIETCLLSLFNIESLVATKAARIVQAACWDGQKRRVIDFGARRAHGLDAGLLAARAAYIGGCDGTSNVLAGQKFGIPVFGTMAHSWVEAFDQEQESFACYHRVFPESTLLLVDTYDTVKAAKKITKFVFKDAIKGVRLDSGNVHFLSKQVRTILDQADLKDVKIMASGNLNEYKILDLVKKKSPIDMFGVGTDLVVSPDCPTLDVTYKLVQTRDDQGVKYKAKRSPRKETIPGKKQIFRVMDQKGRITKDVLGLAGQKPPSGSQPLLQAMIKDGVLVASLPALLESRRYLQQRMTQLSFLDKGLSFDLAYSKELLKVLISTTGK